MAVSALCRIEPFLVAITTRLAGSTILLSDLGMIRQIRNRKDVSRFLNPDELSIMR